MKILHCSDLHYSQDAIYWIEKAKADFDVICITGDFLNTRYNATHTIDEQVAFFRNWFTLFEQPLFVCSGNHDYVNGSLAWMRCSDGFYGDGARVALDGITFGCVGFDCDDFASYADCDIVLYHVPPRGTSCAKELSEDYGSRKLSLAIKHKALSPRYLLCGHVHTPNKNAVRIGETIISNPGGTHTGNVASYALINISPAKSNSV